MHQLDAQLRSRMPGQISQHGVLVYDQFRLPLGGKVLDILR
jgi:hypothetical protein